MIVATDLNGAIGRTDKFPPWKLKAFAKIFQSYTTGDDKVMLVGRVTAEHIFNAHVGPLPGHNIAVLTENPRLYLKGFHMCFNQYEAIETYANKEIWVSGGSGVYKIFLPYARRVIQALVNDEIERADTFFPEMSDEWNCREIFKQKPDIKNRVGYRVLEYTRELA